MELRPKTRDKRRDYDRTRPKRFTHEAMILLAGSAAESVHLDAASANASRDDRRAALRLLEHLADSDDREATSTHRPPSGPDAPDAGVDALEGRDVARVRIGRQDLHRPGTRRRAHAGDHLARCIRFDHVRSRREKPLINWPPGALST